MDGPGVAHATWTRIHPMVARSACWRRHIERTASAFTVTTALTSESVPSIALGISAVPVKVSGAFVQSAVAGGIELDTHVDVDRRGLALVGNLRSTDSALEHPVSASGGISEASGACKRPRIGVPSPEVRRLFRHIVLDRGATRGGTRACERERERVLQETDRDNRVHIRPSGRVGGDDPRPGVLEPHGPAPWELPSGLVEVGWRRLGAMYHRTQEAKHSRYPPSIIQHRLSSSRVRPRA